MAQDLSREGGTADSDAEERFAAALAAAEQDPGDEGSWDLLEEMSERMQRPDEVGALYRRVLAGRLSAELAESLGQRAAHFHEEWFSEDSPHLVEVLARVLELNPEADWALQRLTVVMTVGERWNELLSLYDRALAAASDEQRREQLLEEAAQLAKDFAGEPDRAIDYLKQLLELRRQDVQLISSLERLLERQGRWEELITLWRRRVEGASAADALALRGRIAACYLDNLGDAGAALAEVRALLADGADEAGNLSLLERVVALPGIGPAIRRGALDLLRERYEEGGRGDDVIRVVGVALAFAEGAERVELHRELGARLATKGEAAEAMGHWASVLALDPGAVDAQERLADLAKAASAYETYADALVAAADAAEAGSRQFALLMEAGEVRSGPLGDREGAIELYQRVLSADARPPTKVTVARRLEALLDESERFSERLRVLEDLAELETDAVERRRVLGQCARLAEHLEDYERALGFWQRRLETEPGDLEALDAMIELSERIERWELHVDALRRRVGADVPSLQRRIDLARIANTQAMRLGQILDAVETWQEIRRDFGDDAETVDALFDLLVRAERFEEIHELLQRAATRDAERAAEVLARLADIAREHLGREDEAARAYHRAILMVPELERAREGLRQLLSNPNARASAVRGLAKAYELTDDWQSLLDLLEHRVELALDDDERVTVLREAAELYESRAEQLSAAFDSLRRALRWAPHHPELEAELLRLAKATDRSADAAEALGEAAAALVATKKDRAAELYRRQGQLREERLEDLERALESWLTALSLAPHDEATAAEVVRLGAAAGRWDGAARAVVTISMAREALHEELLSTLEQRAEQADAFAALAAGMAGEIPAPGGLDAALGRALEVRVSRWLASGAGDVEEADAALRRAIEHESTHTETLRALASLQWGNPGRPLVDTLLRLADQFPDDLDPLYDAARTALDPIGDEELATAILDRLLRSARRLWEGTGGATGERSAEEMAVWALDELVRIWLAKGDAAKAVDLLVSGARMPVAPEASRDMRRRAGALCREQLHDEDRALRLLQSVVDESVEDGEAVAQLCGLLEARGRFPELLSLRQRQLDLDLEPAVRFAVRLEVARVLGLIEEAGGRVGVLQDNLREQPGHAESVESLARILSSRGRYVELAELYTTQSVEVEQQGDVARAASLWARAAELFEVQLADVKRALEAHRRVVSLEPSSASLDALARLHMDRGEPAVAAEWLKRRLETSANDEERTELGLRLADAYVSAGQEAQATRVLERMVAADPGALEARRRLAQRYRESESYEPLARLLSEGAPYETDEATRLAYVREAADLYENRLGQPDRAIPVLQMGIELAPEDQALRSKLALGLRVAGRYDEARQILEALVEQFGRRRSPERAAVHYQLAQVAHAAGDLDEAMKQLERARKMDMSHPGILRMAGQMAREAGQLERAEKAYRALLLVVRRQDPGAEDLHVGASEVLYELSLLATEQRDEAQAKELLETALSTASGHDAEAERLMTDLLRRGEIDLALQVVERRLDAVKEPPSEARMLAHRARILADHFDRRDEALEALLSAVQLAPEESALHERCRELAKSMGATARYAATLRELADQSRRKNDAPFVAQVLLRLGEVTERDLGDLDAASELYRRVEALNERVVDAWLALARVADARGDGAEEVRVLRKLVDGGGEVPNDARTQALYRIAEVELAAGRIDDGLQILRDALDREPRYARAGAILQAAVHGVPDDERLLAVYEEVARASGDPSMVLDLLERRAARPDGTLDHVREGVDRADAIEAPERAEALLRRGLVLARAGELGIRDALWVPIGLAERRQAAGDILGAVEHMRSAAEAADGDEGFRLWMRVAELASQDGGDLHLAAETYRSLLQNDPSNRELWEPLANVYAKLQDRAGLEEVVRTTLDALLDPSDRNELRMFYAAFLLDVAEAREDAVGVLKSVLDEEPDHVDAAQRLADIFAVTGDRIELVELLQRQLDRARDRQDVATIVQLSLRMGQLIEPEDVRAAIDFYRAGLDWAPESRELLKALLSHYGEEADARERAELMERLLAVSTGPEAAELANELIALWKALDDEYAAARALDLGFKACPSDPTLRQRLETYYREREEFSELAAMIAYDAANRESLEEATERAQEAAALYRESLRSPSQAAEVIRTVWQRRPEDLGLLEALVGDLVAAGLHSAGAADVAVALEQHQGPTQERAALLRMRAGLELAVGNTESAVQDLEEAYAIAPAESAPDLVAGLDAKRRAANATGDVETERESTHRLAAILRDAGDPEQSRDVLAEWVDRAPHDREALRILRQVDVAAERWADVARHEARRIQIENGEEQVGAALGLADACRRLGRPAEAREGLEHARRAQPAEPRIRATLKALYEEIGARRELATLLLDEAHASEEPEQRFECFRRAGDLMIAEGDAAGALEPLAQAATIKPEDHDLTISLADAYIGSERYQEAVELLQEAINGFKRRRSPHLAAMQLRMARIAGISGDPETQKEWLGVALDADKNNAEVAAELALLAMELGDDETALKALRVVTLQKTSGPMSKAVAFLRQAQIAHRRGDVQKAVLWARRARLEDDQLQEAEEFLAQIGEG